MMREAKRNYEAVSMKHSDYKEMVERMEQAKKENGIMNKKKTYRNCFIAAAAALTIFILPNTSSKIAYAMESIPLVGNLFSVITVRDYNYDENRHRANVEVAEIVLNAKENSEAAENAKQSISDINDKIKTISDEYIKRFEGALDAGSYQHILVRTEVINTTKDYFTLKLLCYDGAGSGTEVDHFYTINLNTGAQVKLSDLFKEGSDYEGIINENIKKQMKEREKADENVSYWYEDGDWDGFKSITDSTSFYVNENDEVVICFSEGEVAPMAMGCVEFVIPGNLLEDIRA